MVKGKVFQSHRAGEASWSLSGVISSAQKLLKVLVMKGASHQCVSAGQQDKGLK